MFSASTLNHAEFTGTIPVLIYLSKDDHASPQPPPPITLQVPRSSLLLAVDPFIRSELLSPDFGAAKSEYLKLTHRSSILSTASSMLPTSPLATHAAAAVTATGGFGASNDKFLVWQDPIGVCVDVMSAHATDTFLIQNAKKRKASSSFGSSGAAAASTNNISPAHYIAGGELISAIKEEIAANRAPNNSAAEGQTSSTTLSLIDNKKRRLYLIASLLDEASSTYHSINRSLRVSEGIFPLKLTVSVDTELPKIPSILWLPGSRSSTTSSTSLTPAGLIPPPSNQVLLYLRQILKQSSQSLFGTIQRVLNSPPSDVEVLQRIPLIARTSSLVNAASESQAIQLLQHQQQQQRQLNKSSGAGGSMVYFSPQQQQQLMMPQQVASRASTVGTADVCDAVNTGKFADFGAAMKWLCEQREKMEGVGGVCEGIPMVIHWITEGQVPSSVATAITIPNPVRGSPFSVAVASSEGQAFTLQQALHYALAQLVCKNYGFGSWLDGDKRKAAAKVATKISRTVGADDDDAAAIAAGCRSALPQLIDMKFIKLAAKAQSTTTSHHTDPETALSSSSPTARTPTGSEQNLSISGPPSNTSPLPAGLEWLHTYLLNSYKFAKITTDNYCDDEELLRRRVEALSRAVQYHTELYRVASGMGGGSGSLSGSLSNVAQGTNSPFDFSQRSKALVPIGVAYATASTAAPTAADASTGDSATESTTTNALTLEVDSLAAASKDAEAATMLRALFLVESMALQQWRDSVLESFEGGGDGNPTTGSNSATTASSPPSLPQLPLLFNSLVNGSVDFPSNSKEASASLALPHIHAMLPRILVNGVEVSSTTPFLWVYSNMGGGDLRLHITIVMPMGSRPVS